MLHHWVLRSNFRLSTASLKKSFMLLDVNTSVLSFMWRQLTARANRDSSVVSSTCTSNPASTSPLSACHPLVFLSLPPLGYSSLKNSCEPRECIEGLLGYFSATHMDLIERLFVTMVEPDPWGSILNPLWADLITNVAEGCAKVNPSKLWI